ncbi:MAG: SLC13 family permease [Prevotellaceae bacterium]|jgi:di/tricarboxylate transporter|nr:SLC13 family permease [Prevotellaceae bacterium]
MLITIIILVLAVIFFIIGKVRSDIVALCALILLMVFNILSPAKALSGFSNSIVIVMVGLFIVGGGIFQTGLASMIGGKIMALAGNSELKLFILVMLAAAGIGAFVSNTGTVAITLPIVVSMAAGSGINSRRILTPLAFASSMGGTLTLIGTPPNLVIHETLIEKGREGLSFFSFLPVGLICVVIGIAALIPLSKLFLSDNSEKEKGKGKKKGKTLKRLANEYQLSDNLYRARVKATSNFANKQIGELDITQKYNINILEIRRRPLNKKPFAKTVNQIISGPATIIEDNDILYVMGTFEDVKVFVEENRPEWVDTRETEDSAPTFSGKLRLDDIGIAEVVVMSDSMLVNTKVRNAGFREKYSINILGIQRGKKYILQNLKEEKIHAGDALLVQGTWSNITRLNDEHEDRVVVGQPLSEASKVTLDHKAPLAALIMVAIIVCMVFNIIPAVAVVLLAAVLMILTRCLRSVEAAYRTINWESIILIGAMLPMSIALEETGVSGAIAKVIVDWLGSIGPTAILAGIYFATSLLTLFISNTATAVLFAPIAFKAAVDFGVSPLPFLFAVAVAASMCFASPFSTPPNALVMSAGRYSFMDYVKVGGPLQIIYGLVMISVLPLLFPF